MVCAPVRRDNPRALARGLSTVQAHKPCSISLVPLSHTMISGVDLEHYRVSRAKDWVSVDHVWYKKQIIKGVINVTNRLVYFQFAAAKI